MNVRILDLQTTRWGMHPVGVASGEQALNLLAGGEHFDVALLDVQMPGMDGYELARRIRLSHSASKLPLLVLTSQGMDGVRSRELGVAQTLAKPIKSAQLMAALTRVLDRTVAIPSRNIGSQSAPAPLSSTATEPLGSSPTTAQPAKVKLANAHPMRILLAEDNLVNQRVAALILQGLGYRIEMAANGEIALQMMHESVLTQAFDLVLMIR